MAQSNQYVRTGGGMSAVNTFLTVVLVGVIVYILFKPSNKSAEIIGALGRGSLNLTRTLSGQYEGGTY
jgi:hypothetical protein